jgi:hypothetical protein
MPCAYVDTLTTRPRTKCPWTKRPRMKRLLDDHPLDATPPGRTIPWTKRPLDKASPGFLPHDKAPLGDGQSVPDYFQKMDKTSPIFWGCFVHTANIMTRIVYQSVQCIILMLIFNIVDAPPAACSHRDQSGLACGHQGRTAWSAAAGAGPPRPGPPEPELPGPDLSEEHTCRAGAALKLASKCWLVKIYEFSMIGGGGIREMFC